MPVFRVERKETRKPVPGFGGRYEVSDLGKVYSRRGELVLIKGRYVNLSYKAQMTRVDVAYLVAGAFLSNLKAFRWVRHIDGDVTNNRVENLEWTDQRPRGKCWEGARRAVMQYDLDGNCLAKYESITDAERETGVARSLIRNCASGRTKRAKKWIFRYA